MFSDFFIIEGWRSKHIQIFQATTLQQLGHGTFQCYAKIRMRTERGKAGTVSRIEQYHANHRILAAKRTIISKDWETFCFQRFDGFNHRWVTRQHVCRDFRQADAFSNNAVFHVAFENFGQPLNACFVAGIASGHTVRNVQVTNDIHRNINGLIVGLARKRQTANTTIFVTGLQVNQHTAGQFILRIVKCAQTVIEQPFWHIVIFAQWEPFFVGIMHERTVGDGFAQPEISKKVVG